MSGGAGLQEMIGATGTVDEKGRSAALPNLADVDEMRATSSTRVIWMVGVFLAAFFVWAWFFEIDEVSSSWAR